MLVVGGLALQRKCLNQSCGPPPPPPPSGVEALKERFLRHMKPVLRPQGESSVQLNIVRKGSAPSGQEELQAESITVTIKEGAEEPKAAKPGEWC